MPPSSRVVALPLALALVLLGTFVAQAGEPPCIQRGRQTEVQQAAYHDRLLAFYRTLSDRLRVAAPDLMARLEPPPRVAAGYQILPRIVPDTPLPSPVQRPRVTRFSWAWSETLIAHELGEIAKMEDELARLSERTEARAAYERLAEAYRRAQAERRRVDSNISHTGFWQRTIFANPARFDRENEVMEAALAAQAIDDALEQGDEARLRSAARKENLGDVSTVASLRQALKARASTLRRDVRQFTSGVRAPGFGSVVENLPRRWTLAVPIYTDVTDAAFVEAFRAAVENAWHVSSDGRDYRVRLTVKQISAERLYCGQEAADVVRADCSPPNRAAPIDVRGHVERFPLDGGVLTTGAASLHVTAERAIVLGPHDVSPRTLAHEFGHVLGFRDGYLRGYRDLGSEGIEVRELTPDPVDIMSATRSGEVTAYHFEQLVSLTDAKTGRGTATAAGGPAIASTPRAFVAMQDQ